MGRRRRWSGAREKGKRKLAAPASFRTSPTANESKLAGAVPTFVISRDILRLPRCTRLCRYPMHAYIHAAWECKNSPDLPRCAESVLALCRAPKKEGKEIRISLTSSSARARVRQTNWLRFAPSWLLSLIDAMRRSLVVRRDRLKYNLDRWNNFNF